MTGQHWFSPGNGDGFSYDQADDAAQWLYERPEYVETYTNGMYGLADNFAAWGDFKGMRDTLNLLVDVRIAVAKLSGGKHLE